MNHKKRFEVKQQDGKGLHIGIISARWNQNIISALVKGAKQALAEGGVGEDSITHIQVPGSYELPFAAKSLIVNGAAKGRPFDAVVCVGCLIKGDTTHYEYICEAVTQGITNVGLQTGVPVIFGVLTCLTEEQALIRAAINGPNQNEGHNHGIDWGATALEMANLKFPVAYSML